MKIKDLIKILDQAPDKDRNVYIPHTITTPTSKLVRHLSSTNIGNNFDDKNDLDLYVICED